MGHLSQKLFKSIVLCTTFFLPGIAIAATDIGAISFEAADTNISATTTYTVTMGVMEDIPSGTTITIAMQSSNEGETAVTSGYDFSGASFNSDTITANGSTSSSGEWAYELFLTGTLVASTDTLYTFELDGVVNSSIAGCYRILATTGSFGETGNIAVSDEALAIGGESCDGEEGDDSGAPQVTVDGFGTNLIVAWEAYDGATQYDLHLDNDDDIENGIISSELGIAETSFVLSGLDVETTYYVTIIAKDASDTILSAGYPVTSGTTEDSLDTQRFTTPKVKKITATQARVQWSEPAYVDYITKYMVQVRMNTSKAKPIKTYKNVANTKAKQLFKALKSGKKYKARMKAVYSFNDEDQTTKWSVFKPFKTK